MRELFGISGKFWYLIFGNAAVATALLIVNNFVFRAPETIYQMINVMSTFIFAFPIILVKYMQYGRKKQLEELFPVFLRDFVETIRSGMSVPQALATVSGNDYKALSSHIKKMSAQLEWGISVEKVLMKFVKETKSKLIGRIVSSVIESHNFGGNLAETFDALSRTAVEVEKLRQERRLYLNSQLITGYIVFFVFLLVIIGLERFLVPSLADVSPLSLGGPNLGVVQHDLADQYKEIFRNLIIVQGLFAGLAVGKMAEGAVVAGVKHSLFMVFVGVVVFILAA